MAAMRVVMVSKALVAGAYQRKAEEIARLGVELTVLVPPNWGDRRGRQVAAPRYTDGYTYRVIPVRFNGHFHLHFYPTMRAELAALRPDLLHMDEEPYNLATWHAIRAAAALHIPATFFTWQNIRRRYPPPFAWLEKANYRRVRVAIAGSEEAAAVLRAKGFAGDVAVIPQFGVDPALFSPADASPSAPLPARPLSIGYAGGLLPEKGVDLLLQACAGLQGAWQLTVAGEGSEAAALQALANRLGIAGQVLWRGRVDSAAMPDLYRELDVLVLPSRTLPSWKEQFGRVLVEAMACEVAVLGSDSGEIPQVIGPAGLLFPENDAGALGAQLQLLLDEPARLRELGRLGRRRVLERFTMAQVAARTLEVYRQLVEAGPCT